MHLPPPRVREVLSVLGDLNPAEARALLGEVVATLDAAELLALRHLLPPQATKLLPHCVGAVTVMNEDPMPWEFVEPPAGPTTGEIIAATLPRTDWKPRLVAAGALMLTALTVVVFPDSSLRPSADSFGFVPLRLRTVVLAWPTGSPPAPAALAAAEPELAPLPPKQHFAEIPMVPAATATPRPAARKAEKRPVAQKAPVSDLKRPAEVADARAPAPAPKKSAKSAPNEWASPFERRQ